MSDYPYQITEDMKLGRVTFFIDQTNKNMMSSGWIRQFKLTVFYNGKPWYLNTDISYYTDATANNLDTTRAVLSYSCLELVEFIMKELDLCMI